MCIHWYIDKRHGIAITYALWLSEENARVWTEEVKSYWSIRNWRMDDYLVNHIGLTRNGLMHSVTSVIKLLKFAIDVNTRTAAILNVKKTGLINLVNATVSCIDATCNQIVAHVNCKDGVIDNLTHPGKSIYTLPTLIVTVLDIFNTIKENEKKEAKIDWVAYNSKLISFEIKQNDRTRNVAIDVAHNKIITLTHDQEMIPYNASDAARVLDYISKNGKSRALVDLRGGIAKAMYKTLRGETK